MTTCMFPVQRVQSCQTFAQLFFGEQPACSYKVSDKISRLVGRLFSSFLSRRGSGKLDLWLGVASTVFSSVLLSFYKTFHHHIFVY